MSPRAFFRRLASCASGIAMTEFAMLLPVMVVLYFGTIEVTQAIIAKRKVNLIASTMADLVTRAKTVSRTDLNSTFAAAGAIMAPIDTSTMRLRISSVVVYPGGGTCVDWSVGQNMTGLTAGSTTTVPSSITAVASTTARDFILAEASIDYVPATHKFIPTSIKLSEGPTFLVPRQSDRVLADTTIQTPAAPCS